MTAADEEAEEDSKVALVVVLVMNPLVVVVSESVVIDVEPAELAALSQRTVTERQKRVHERKNAQRYTGREPERDSERENVIQ